MNALHTTTEKARERKRKKESDKNHG